MCVCKKLWGWLRTRGSALDLEGGLHAGDIAGSESRDELWVSLDVTVDVVHIDRLTSDGEFRRLIGSIAIALEDHDGKDLVTLELLVQAPLPDPRLEHLDPVPVSAFDACPNCTSEGRLT